MKIFGFNSPQNRLITGADADGSVVTISVLSFNYISHEYVFGWYTTGG